MVPADTIALVASAGGLGVISQILEDLPRSLPASVVVLQHMPEKSVLAEILARRTELAVGWAEEGTRVEHGHVYVVPGQAMVGLAGDRFVMGLPIRTSQNPADVLLETFAETLGERLLAVVLTGTGNDGAYGAAMVQRAGGTVFAQDPSTAAYPEMPLAAINGGCVDLVLPAHALGAAISRSVSGSVAETGRPVPDLGRQLREHVRAARAPLASLLAEVHGSLTSGQRAATRIAADAVAAIGTVADRLRWLERFQTGGIRPERSRVDVTALTLAIAERYRAIAAQQGQQLTVDCGEAAPSQLDPIAWEWIVGGLLENALAGGRREPIAIVQRRQRKHVELEIRGTTPHRDVQLTLVDEVLALQRGVMQIEDHWIKVWVPVR